MSLVKDASDANANQYAHKQRTSYVTSKDVSGPDNIGFNNKVTFIDCIYYTM